MTPTEHYTRDRTLGFTLASVVVTAFIAFIFIPPEHLNPATLPVVRFLAALSAALAAYLFMGSMRLGGQMPLFNRMEVRAAGSFAVFLIVLLLFFWGLPTSGERPQPTPVDAPAAHKTSKLELTLPPTESAATPATTTTSPKESAEVPPLPRQSAKKNVHANSPSAARRKRPTGVVASPYSSVEAYLEAFEHEQQLTEKPRLIEVDAYAAAAWAEILGTTKWQGDQHWGIVTFDADGRRATFTNGPRKASGVVLIQCTMEVPPPAYYKLFTIGEWRQSDGRRGWLLIDDMRTDDATGELTSLKLVWGPKFRLEDTWKRLSRKGGA